jgi:Lar family restriction alleviation protein
MSEYEYGEYSDVEEEEYTPEFIIPEIKRCGTCAQKCFFRKDLNAACLYPHYYLKNQKDINSIIELLPCPFCGSLPALKDDAKGPWKYQVVCLQCGGASDTYSSENKAIEAWNRRA